VGANKGERGGLQKRTKIEHLGRKLRKKSLNLSEVGIIDLGLKGKTVRQQ